MIAHHPSEDLLRSFAAGALRAGAALAVRCHLDHCDSCRRTVALWNALGGALIESLPRAELSAGALKRVLRRIDTMDEAPSRVAPLPDYLTRFAGIESLRGQSIGMRRWVAPGIWFAPVHLRDSSPALTYLVYADKGTLLPRHTHEKQELTVVLSGSFRDDLGVFGPGDFAEADEDVLHAPNVTQEAECLCLSYSDGPMRFEGRSARWIQALAGRLY